MSTKSNFLALDPFCYRQWDSTKSNCINISKTDFLDNVEQYYQANKTSLTDGYAPFCKHIFMPNFTNLKASCLKITDENKHLIQTDYITRSEGELPVLVRYFPSSMIEQVPIAEYIDVILYSREQIRAENKAMNMPENPETAPWGIISVKAQSIDHEIPMQPITMLRNALGKEEGGSGVKLDREKYIQSVNFWKDHVPIL